MSKRTFILAVILGLFSFCVAVVGAWTDQLALMKLGAFWLCMADLLLIIGVIANRIWR